MLFKKNPSNLNETYDRIMFLLVNNISHSYLEVSAEMVMKALEGKAVRLADTVKTENEKPRETLTISECITAGYYLDSLVDKENRVVPVMSPLMLRAFAQRQKVPDSLEPSDPDKTLILANHIQEMLKLEPNFHAKLFENFHANWEVLIRLIKLLDKPMSLLQFYGIEATRDPKTKKLIPDPTPILQFSPKENVVDVQKQNLTTTDIGFDNVSIPASPNNPGFDMVLDEKRYPDGLPFTIAFQCKWSYENADTQLGRKELETAWKNTKENLAVPEKHLFLVVVAWRKTTRELSTLHTQDIPDIDPPKKYQILVLDKKRLERLYSPTLAQRPEFLMKLPKIKK
jgi:hypothetical protein